MSPSSSASMNSTYPISTRSSNSSSPDSTASTSSSLMRVSPSSTTSSGRRARPASALTMTSRVRSSTETLTMSLTSPRRRASRICSASCSGSGCVPTRLPLTYTLASRCCCWLMLVSLRRSLDALDAGDALDAHRRQLALELAFVLDVLGQLHRLREVLHESTVRSLRRLGRTDPSPLRGVQVPRLEVGLAARERAAQAPQVRQNAHEVGTVDQLGDARAAADPVARRDRVFESLGQDVRADDRVDREFPVPHVGALELVLHVAGQLVQRSPEQVLHEVAADLQTLVRVVVLVVGLAPAERELETGLGHPAEVVRFVDPDVLLVDAVLVEVRQEVPVDDVVGSLELVVLPLAGGDALAQRLDGLLGRLDLGGLQVLQHELHDLGVVRDAVDDLLVGFEAERTDERDEVDAPRHRGERHFEQAVAGALDEHQRTIPPALAERLGDLNLVAVLAVVLREDLVRREVLAGHQHALGAVDDEVAAGVGGVLADLDEFVVVEAGDVTLGRADHDRHPADLRLGAVDDPVLALFGVALHDLHLHEDGRRVGDVAQARLLRVEQFFAPVGLADAGGPDPNVAEFDVDGLLALLVADVGVDRLLLVDDLLHPSVEERVERAVVMFCESVLPEILPRNLSSVFCVHYSTTSRYVTARSVVRESRTILTTSPTSASSGSAGSARLIFGKSVRPMLYSSSTASSASSSTTVCSGTSSCWLTSTMCWGSYRREKRMSRDTTGC